MEPFEEVFDEFQRQECLLILDLFMPSPRVFRRRIVLDHLSDRVIFEITRLNRPAVEALYERVRRYVDPVTERTRVVPGMTRLLISLQFLATGSFQKVGAMACGVSQPTVCRILDKFLYAMGRIFRSFIHFPTSAAERDVVKVRFSSVANFPNVMGAIDCSHIPLVPPQPTEYLYRNRHRTHSINVQFVCGPAMEIYDICARFPGSVHDSFILRRSGLFNRMEQGEIGSGWFLGDAGYPCRHWLMTPVGNPSSESHEKYNLAHQKTRMVIERCFGLLKSRFRCLDKTGGTLMYAPQKVASMVVACAVLHNIAINYNVQEYLSMEDVVQRSPGHQSVTESTQSVDGSTQRGQEVRERLIQNNFCV